MHLTAILLVAAAVTAVWSLFATRLAHWRVAPALVLAIAGAATAQVSRVELSTALALPTTERIVEMVLALLLFVDATEVKGGLLGHDRRGALRLLLIGLPLSLAAATALGAFLFPGVGLAILVLLACAVMPTDLSANGSLFRNRAVPRRVGRLLNVESGYNDGIVAPIFVCALVLVEHTSGEREFWDAVGEGVYSTAVAIGIGGAIGFVAAFAANRALAHSLTSTRALGITVIMVALLAYGGAVLLEGNGFVAAFVCGITYRAARTVQELGGSELEFLEDVTLLCNVVMWFGFGLLIDYLLDLGWAGWPVIIFALAAVTVLRAGPVMLALTGRSYTRREKTLIAFLGPRGTASIVFGLLAWIKIPDYLLDEASLALLAVAWTVVLSLVVYSIAAITLGRQHNRTGADVEH